MFLSTATRILNLDRFAHFDVGGESSQGIYPVRAFYPDSDRHETLYANTNIEHCWEYLHKLEHLINAQEVDLRSACICEEPEIDDSVDHTIPDDQY